MLLFYIKFGDRNPPFHQQEDRTVVSLSSMQGVFAESLLLKQAWRNCKKGRVGCLHQNIFTRKVTEIAYIAIIIHILRPPLPPRPCIWRPASPSHTSPRSILDVPKSLVPRPRVTSPHTRVPMSPSPCPRPSFIHSPKEVIFTSLLINLLVYLSHIGLHFKYSVY